MAEWLYEAGIGEARAALVVDGMIVEAQIEPDDDAIRAGTVSRARLTERLAPHLARVTLDNGAEAMLDRPPPASVSEGSPVTIVIDREAVLEAGRPKRPRARLLRPDEAATPRAGPDLLVRITASGIPVRRCHAHEPDRLEAAGWSELLEEAQSGDIAFPGGQLRMAVTPAMTLFDIDGAPPLTPLAIAGARAVADAIRRFGIGGSIGIDFPTLPDKAARNAVAEAIDAALPQPFERTAVNGFGFLQIVRRRERPSLPELLAADPVGAKTRALLRRIEHIPPPGPASHIVPERVARYLKARPDWTAQLARRTGRPAIFEPQSASGA